MQFLECSSSKFNNNKLVYFWSGPSFSQHFDTVIIFALPDKRIFRIDHKSNPNGG